MADGGENRPGPAKPSRLLTFFCSSLSRPKTVITVHGIREDRTWLFSPGGRADSQDPMDRKTPYQVTVNIR